MSAPPRPELNLRAPDAGLGDEKQDSVDGTLLKLLGAGQETASAVQGAAQQPAGS